MTRLIESQRRRLLRRGFIFLFIAVWLGIATAVLPHARAWLAAHLTAFLTCLILVAIGLVWRELRLTERQRLIGLTAGFTSAYLGLVGNIFGAIADLPGPPSQPGVAAPMPQAAIFFTLLAIVVPTTLIAFGLVMYGMRGEPDLGYPREGHGIRESKHVIDSMERSISWYERHFPPFTPKS